MAVKAGFVAGFAILLGVGFAAVFQTLEWERSVRWTSRSHNIIETVDSLSLHARDAVDEARVFSDLGDQRNIAKIWEELDSARVRVERLAQYLADTPGDAVHVEKLRRLIDREYEVFSLNSTAAKKRKVLQAIAVFERAGIGARIDAATKRIREEQYRLLQIRANDQTIAAQQTRYLLLGASMASFLVIVIAFSRSTFERRRRSVVERALAMREGQYRQVVEEASDIIYRTDVKGRFTFCNQTALATLHLTEREVIGRSYLKMIRHDRRRDAERFYLRQYARRKKHTYYEFPIVDGHGRERWLGQNVQLIVEGGEVAGFQAIARDISERKRTELELNKSRIFIEKIAAATPGILYVYDMEDGRNVFANRELFTVLGYRPEEMSKIGELMDTLIHPDDLNRVCSHHTTLRHTKDGEVCRIEYRARHADGRWLWLATRDTPFERGTDGHVKQIVGIAQDITQRKSAEEQMEYQANYDALTGLSNRHHFFVRLNSALRRVSIEHSTLSACVMDIDHFKAINDRYGHASGDEVLQTVGHIIRSEMRGSDIAGRLGGDEFCMILVGADGVEAASAAERVRNRLTTLAFGLGTGSPFTVTATFGVAEVRRDGTSRELLELADEALYKAKNMGRNRIITTA